MDFGIRHVKNGFSETSKKGDIRNSRAELEQNKKDLKRNRSPFTLKT